MKVSFLLNYPSRHPFGGYKIIYTYADYLAKKGIDVILVYQCQNAFNKHR